MTPLLLVHGAGLDSRVWSRLLPHLSEPAIAVDLPGRGRRPEPPSSLDAYAEAVVEDADAEGFDDVVVVAHSAAACAMPTVVRLLGRRLLHVVYVAAIVPAPGESAYDAGSQSGSSRAVDVVSELLGNDLDVEQLSLARTLLVREHQALTRSAVDTTALHGVSGSWIRTLQDRVVPPGRQTEYIGRLGLGADVVDLDAGHLCMLSRPRELATVLDACAEQVGRAAE